MCREFIQLSGCLQQLETTGPSFFHQHTEGALGLGQVFLRCQCRLAAGESVRQLVPCSRERLFVLVRVGTTRHCGSSHCKNRMVVCLCPKFQLCETIRSKDYLNKTRKKFV